MTSRSAVPCVPVGTASIGWRRFGAGEGHANMRPPREGGESAGASISGRDLVEPGGIEPPTS